MRRALKAMLAITAAIAALAATIATPPALAGAARRAPQATAAHADTGSGGGAHHRRNRRRRHRHHAKHRHHKHHRRHKARRHRRDSSQGQTSGSQGSGIAGTRDSATRASFDCANANLTPTASNLDVVRAATLCLINRERLTHGERPLQLDGRLERAAQGHTEEMVAQDYFSHYAPSGEGPASRMRAAGYIYSSNIGYEVGENIAWGTLYMATPSAIVEAWMQSPGHRANILDPRFKNTAIGVLATLPHSYGKGQQGAIYTQDFGVIIAG
jgi:uncharacterized protein YkwD